MPTIEITEAQKEYIEDLREELAAHHVGEYGTVRTRDAVQFLVDHHEPVAAVEGEADADLGAEDGTGEPSESGDEDGSESGDDGGGEGRLNAMMQLLEEHDEAWEEVDSDQGKYAVTLPDGDTEHVRTKDDVRALLFRHYD
ncbi:MAG: hypothetical protein ABEH66_00965 [Halobacteriales archaeon]